MARYLGKPFKMVARWQDIEVNLSDWWPGGQVSRYLGKPFKLVAKQRVPTFWQPVRERNLWPTSSHNSFRGEWGMDTERYNWGDRKRER